MGHPEKNLTFIITTKVCENYKFETDAVWRWKWLMKKYGGKCKNETQKDEKVKAEKQKCKCPYCGKNNTSKH